MQTGSLPVYLGTILLTLVVLPGTALVAADDRSPTTCGGWDRPLQVVVAVVIAVAAVSAARAHRRFTAVLHLGAVGYGVAVLFVLQGGPDLALTQFLVETLTLVVFVFVLRRLPPTFTRRPLRASQAGPRGVIAAAVGRVRHRGGRWSAAQARTAPPVSQELPRPQLARGAGAATSSTSILVDFRGFDTLGEITVLAVAAMGVASLVLAGRAAAASRPPARPR